MISRGLLVKCTPRNGTFNGFTTSQGSCTQQKENDYNTDSLLTVYEGHLAKTEGVKHLERETIGMQFKAVVPCHMESASTHIQYFGIYFSNTFVDRRSLCVTTLRNKIRVVDVHHIRGNN